MAAAMPAGSLSIAGCQDQHKPAEGLGANNMQLFDDYSRRGYDRATFAAGCFWGVEAAFRSTAGVKATRVGYTGGLKENATYKEVCSGTTGHAEAVDIIFDPGMVSYDQLLDIFWSNHNPTTVNRQGPDVGSQYRSAVFHHDQRQKAAAEASRDRLVASGKWSKPVVTEIVPAGAFWVAEDYHQQYLEKRGQSSCHSGVQ